QYGKHVGENGPLDEEFRDHGSDPLPCVGRSGRRLHLRIDLLAWYGPQHAGDHHAVLRIQTGVDHAPLLHTRADLDLALHDDVVLIHDQDIAPTLIAADG